MATSYLNRNMNFNLVREPKVESRYSKIVLLYTFKSQESLTEILPFSTAPMEFSLILKLSVYLLRGQQSKGGLLHSLSVQSLPLI